GSRLPHSRGRNFARESQLTDEHHAVRSPRHPRDFVLCHVLGIYQDQNVEPANRERSIAEMFVSAQRVNRARDEVGARTQALLYFSGLLLQVRGPGASKLGLLL